MAAPLAPARRRRPASIVLRALLLVGLIGLAALAAALTLLNQRDEMPLDPVAASRPLPPQAVERGEYLTRAGNCLGCHTARGGRPWAGGRGIDTAFGVVYASNLTPDPETGLGHWNASHFWRAMHNGRSRDGRLLYPAFPYPHYTQVTREDSDAIFAFLRAQPPVTQPNTAHALRFPYDTQFALAVWRALWFRPATWRDQPERDESWNRGAYLVRTLGHCSACHGARNAWGAIDPAREWSGSAVTVRGWYAPSLLSAAEAGVAHWPVEDVVALLRDGASPQASVLGPMAEVVHRGTQYLSDADLRSMAVFLRSLPQDDPGQGAAQAPAVRDREPRMVDLGERIYGERCASCHGDAGEGIPGAFPPLAGNRAVTMDNPVNAIRAVLSGGFLPSTAGNPRPHGMPPFGHLLNDEQVAAVVSHVRLSWGNRAPQVSYSDVVRLR